MDLRDLYQEMILDHYKKPRNYRAMPDADASVEGYNPLCGDHYTVYLKKEGDRIDEISFQGEGCAISKASASVMTGLLKGKTRDELATLFDDFRRLVSGEIQGADAEAMGRLAAFAGVAEHPSRVKCAVLAWHAAKNAMEGTEAVASTE